MPILFFVVFFLIFYICCYLRARHDGPKWIFAPLAQSVRFYCYTFCCCYYCLLLLLLLCLLFVAVVILVYFAKIANYFVQMYINRPPPLNCLLQLCADNSTVVQRCVWVIRWRWIECCVYDAQKVAGGSSSEAIVWNICKWQLCFYIFLMVMSGCVWVLEEYLFLFLKLYNLYLSYLFHKILICYLYSYYNIILIYLVLSPLFLISCFFIFIFP